MPSLLVLVLDGWPSADKLFISVCNHWSFSMARPNEYQQKLGHKQAHRVMHWYHICGLTISFGVWLRAKETEISAV